MSASDLLIHRPDVPDVVPGPGRPPRPGRPLGARRAERRRLAALDRAGARRAALHRVRALLVEAGTVVDRGWCQDAWFVVTDARGVRHRLHAPTAALLAGGGREVTEACLVGALVLAGGGPTAVATGPVRQALDLTWGVLVGDRRVADAPPVPVLQGLRVRELTRWNDARGRTGTEVAGLLAAAADVAGRAAAVPAAHAA